MVGQRPLKPLIGVRIPVSQHERIAAFRAAFSCWDTGAAFSEKALRGFEKVSQIV
jgi:hypothetical protein